MAELIVVESNVTKIRDRTQEAADRTAMFTHMNLILPPSKLLGKRGYKEIDSPKLVAPIGAYGLIERVWLRRSVARLGAVTLLSDVVMLDPFEYANGHPVGASAGALEVPTEEFTLYANGTTEAHLAQIEGRSTTAPELISRRLPAIVALVEAARTYNMATAATRTPAS